MSESVIQWKVCRGCFEFKRTEKGYCYSCRPGPSALPPHLEKGSPAYRYTPEQEAERQRRLAVYVQQTGEDGKGKIDFEAAQRIDEVQKVG